jgi:hypothetical protein
MSRAVERDERTIAIENASYRWSYLTLSFGLLALSAARSLVRHEATWDLFGLVIIGGVVKTVYQASHRVLTPRWARLTLTAMAAAAVLAIVIVVVILLLHQPA